MACCLCLMAIVAVLALVCLRFLLEKLRLGKLSEKPVFITGCDSGFGYLLALKLLGNNMPVFAGCLTEKGEDELRKSAGELPGKLEVVSLNVSRQDSVDTAVKFVKGKLAETEQALWALVNNAGVMGNTATDDFLRVEDYQLCLDVNALGVVRCTQAFKPLIKKSRGRIVTVASVLGRNPQQGAGPYVMSKFAVEGYCDVLRQELSYFKVSVHILEPAFFATNITNPDLVKKSWQRLWDRTTDEVRTEYGQAYFDQSLKSITEYLPMMSSPKTELVVDAYFHALTARFPRKRYWVGMQAVLLWIPLSMLPTCLQDLVLKGLRTLVKAPVPEAAQ